MVLLSDLTKDESLWSKAMAWSYLKPKVMIGFHPEKTSLDVFAGDTIVVPVKIKLPSKWIENLAMTTQITYQIALSAAALQSF